MRHCADDRVIAARPRFLNWPLHFLSCDLKRKRVELAKELLDILPFEEHTLFHSIITGDESHFDLNYSSDHIWTGTTDDVPQRVSRQIQSEKVMLTVLWLTMRPTPVKWME
jgi:hypothetical protein